MFPVIVAMVIDSMAGNLRRCAAASLGVTIGAVALILVGSLDQHIAKVVSVSRDLSAHRIVAVVDPSLWLTNDADRELEGLRWNLTRFPGVHQVDSVISAPYELNPRPGSRTAALLVIAETSDDRSATTLRAGRWVGEAERGAVVLGSDFAALVGAEIQSTIVLHGSSYRVVGILTKSYSYYDTFAIVSPPAAASVFYQVLPHGAPRLPTNPLSAFTLRLSGNADRIRLVQDIDKLPYLHAYDPLDRLQEFESTFELLRSIMAGCMGIGIVVAVSSIFNAMAAAVRERIPEIGLRLALGATRAQIFQQFLTEAAVLGVTGAVVGAAVAQVLGDLQDATAREHGWSGLFVPEADVVLGVGIACIVLAIVAGVVPARDAARMQPVDALRRTGM